MLHHPARVAWFACLATFHAFACGGSSEDAANGDAGASGTSGTGGASAGTAGAAGKSGAGGGGNGGAGGQAAAGGAAGQSGTAGQSGKGGAAGQAGTAGQSGTGGLSGAGGQAGNGGQAGVGGASGGGNAGAPGGAAGASGTSGTGGTGGCASGLLCGLAGTCCAVGQDCVSAACVAACPNSGVHCAGACCPGGSVCLAGKCEVPTGSCLDSIDCNAKQFCDPGLGKCLPQPEGVSICEYKSPTLTFAPVLKWSWTSTTILPGWVASQGVPIVGDMDKDGTPDIAIITFVTNVQPAVLRLLDGKTGKEKWPASADVFKAENYLKPATTVAMGDVDDDGTPEIVAPLLAGGLIAVRPDGSVKWRSTNPDGTPYVVLTPYLASVSIARMNGDKQAEIVLGGEVFDSKGVHRTPGGHEKAGMNGPTYGPDSLIADVDGDGTQDIVSGNLALRLDGSVIWDNKQPDGYNALSDLDKDGAPEIIVTSLGNVRVQSAKTGAVLAALVIPGGGASGGPPTVADFDGDGVMDFATAGSNFYTVFGYTSKPTPAITVKWSSPTQDLSPGTTGSSVFDFDGDGASEVMYNDECFLRVYDGKTGKTLWQVPNSSLTGVDHPIAVDVDGDGHTEIVVGSAKTCASPSPEGLFVYADPLDRWVRTRRVWNQHTYHITNINADLSLPGPEIASWGPSGFDTYRVSAQGRNNAPDLLVDPSVSLSTCPTGIIVRAAVMNAGAYSAPAGVKVSLYLGPDASGKLLAEKTTQGSILPGGTEIVELAVTFADIGSITTLFVVVDGDDKVRECVETNNTGKVSVPSCKP